MEHSGIVGIVASCAVLLATPFVAGADNPAEATEGDAQVTKRGVVANKMSLVHKSSSGIIYAFPDLCRTPAAPAPLPIPYPDVGRGASELEAGRYKIKGGGELVVKKAAKGAKSTADEPGVLKGISSKNRLTAQFIGYSFDVKFEKNVTRVGDPLFQNKKNIMGRGVESEEAVLIELEDGSFCAVCLRKGLVSSIYKLRHAARAKRRR